MLYITLIGFLMLFPTVYGMDSLSTSSLADQPKDYQRPKGDVTPNQPPLILTKKSKKFAQRAATAYIATSNDPITSLRDLSQQLITLHKPLIADTSAISTTEQDMKRILTENSAQIFTKLPNNPLFQESIRNILNSTMEPKIIRHFKEGLDTIYFLSHVNDLCPTLFKTIQSIYTKENLLDEDAINDTKNLLAILSTNVDKTQNKPSFSKVIQNIQKEIDLLNPSIPTQAPIKLKPGQIKLIIGKVKAVISILCNEKITRTAHLKEIEEIIKNIENEKTISSNKIKILKTLIDLPDDIITPSQKFFIREQIELFTKKFKAEQKLIALIKSIKLEDKSPESLLKFKKLLDQYIPLVLSPNKFKIIRDNIVQQIALSKDYTSATQEDIKKDLEQLKDIRNNLKNTNSEQYKKLELTINKLSKLLQPAKQENVSVPEVDATDLYSTIKPSDGNQPKISQPDDFPFVSDEGIGEYPIKTQTPPSSTAPKQPTNPVVPEKSTGWGAYASSFVPKSLNLWGSTSESTERSQEQQPALPPRSTFEQKKKEFEQNVKSGKFILGVAPGLLNPVIESTINEYYPTDTPDRKKYLSLLENTQTPVAEGLQSLKESLKTFSREKNDSTASQLQQELVYLETLTVNKEATVLIKEKNKLENEVKTALQEYSKSKPSSEAPKLQPRKITKLLPYPSYITLITTLFPKINTAIATKNTELLKETISEFQSKAPQLLKSSIDTLRQNPDLLKKEMINACLQNDKDILCKSVCFFLNQIHELQRNPKDNAEKLIRLTRNDLSESLSELQIQNQTLANPIKLIKEIISSPILTESKMQACLILLNNKCTFYSETNSERAKEIVADIAFSFNTQQNTSNAIEALNNLPLINLILSPKSKLENFSEDALQENKTSIEIILKSISQTKSSYTELTNLLSSIDAEFIKRASMVKPEVPQLPVEAKLVAPANENEVVLPIQKDFNVPQPTPALTKTSQNPQRSEPPINNPKIEQTNKSRQDPISIKTPPQLRTTEEPALPSHSSNPAKWEPKKYAVSSGKPQLVQALEDINNAIIDKDQEKLDAAIADFDLISEDNPLNIHKEKTKEYFKDSSPLKRAMIEKGKRTNANMIIDSIPFFMKQISDLQSAQSENNTKLIDLVKGDLSVSLDALLAEKNETFKHNIELINAIVENSPLNDDAIKATRMLLNEDKFNSEKKVYDEVLELTTSIASNYDTMAQKKESNKQELITNAINGLNALDRVNALFSPKLNLNTIDLQAAQEDLTTIRNAISPLDNMIDQVEQLLNTITTSAKPDKHIIKKRFKTNSASASIGAYSTENPTITTPVAPIPVPTQTEKIAQEPQSSETVPAEIPQQLVVDQNDLNTRVIEAYKNEDDDFSTIYIKLYNHYSDQKSFEPGQLELLKNQITDTLIKINPPYYDENTNLLTEAAVNDAALEAIQGNFSRQIEENIIYNKFNNKMAQKWFDLKFTEAKRDKLAGKLMRQIRKAIKNANERIEQIKAHVEELNSKVNANKKGENLTIEDMQKDIDTLMSYILSTDEKKAPLTDKNSTYYISTLTALKLYLNRLHRQLSKTPDIIINENHFSWLAHIIEQLTTLNKTTQPETKSGLAIETLIEFLREDMTKHTNPPKAHVLESEQKVDEQNSLEKQQPKLKITPTPITQPAVLAPTSEISQNEQPSEPLVSKVKEEAPQTQLSPKPLETTQTSNENPSPGTGKKVLTNAPQIPMSVESPIVSPQPTMPIVKAQSHKEAEIRNNVDQLYAKVIQDKTGTSFTVEGMQKDINTLISYISSTDDKKAALTDQNSPDYIKTLNTLKIYFDRLSYKSLNIDNTINVNHFTWLDQTIKQLTILEQILQPETRSSLSIDNIITILNKKITEDANVLIAQAISPQGKFSTLQLKDIEKEINKYFENDILPETKKRVISEIEKNWRAATRTIEPYGIKYDWEKIDKQYAAPSADEQYEVPSPYEWEKIDIRYQKAPAEKNQPTNFPTPPLSSQENTLLPSKENNLPLVPKEEPISFWKSPGAYIASWWNSLPSLSSLWRTK